MRLTGARVRQGKAGILGSSFNQQRDKHMPEADKAVSPQN